MKNNNIIDIPVKSDYIKTQASKSVDCSYTLYQTKKDSEVIQNVEKTGYFLVPTKSYLQQNCSSHSRTKFERTTISYDLGENEETTQNNLNDILMVRLPQLHIRQIGDIGLCMQMRICILSNNYLTQFDALQSCRHLLRLDLHSNQINKLPKEAFWNNMINLKILNLHDNPLGNITVSSNKTMGALNLLSLCKSLKVLTLYDTPLSLKPNYRHHVVNRIWTLCALDNRVIADDEIIEGANFTGRFSAKNESLTFDTSINKESNFQTELSSVEKTLCKINSIMAHFSPILIIQRYIRGFLARRKFSMMTNLRTSASIKIQRKFRQWKGKKSFITGKSQNTTDQKATSNSKLQLVSKSTDLLKASGISKDTNASSNDNTDTLRCTSSSRKIIINLSKLELDTLQNLNKDVSQGDRSNFSEDFSKKVKKHTRADKNIKEDSFFNQTKNQKDKLNQQRVEEPQFFLNQENNHFSEFRLKGFRKEINFFDIPLTLHIAKHIAARDIRDAILENHCNEELQRRENSKIKYPNQPKRLSASHTNKLFGRIQGTMDISCLRSVQAAYTDRNRAERRAAQAQLILAKRVERARVRHCLEEERSKRRENILCEKRILRENVNSALLNRNESHYDEVSERYKETRSTSSRLRERIKQEKSFTNEFCSHNSSISSALLRHDSTMRSEKAMRLRSENVEVVRQNAIEQRNTVRRFMEQRRMLRQTETALTRAALDTHMLKEANERLLEAQLRTSRQRTQIENVNTFYKLPAVSGISFPVNPLENSLELKSE